MRQLYSQWVNASHVCDSLLPGRASPHEPSGGSLFAILAAFVFGVFVGFTPCVYPILPITVAYIGSIARGSKLNGFIYSLIYVLGMAIVYSTIGVITAITGGQIGRIWSNGWVLLALANFFILLALWQLKVIQISVPQIIRGAGPRRAGRSERCWSEALRAWWSVPARCRGSRRW